MANVSVRKLGSEKIKGPSGSQVFHCMPFGSFWIFEPWKYLFKNLNW